MGHDSERAAMIYQKTRGAGADKRITDAIDTHVQGEQHKDDDDDDGRPVPSSPGLMAR